jgi:sensor c-di-GMP phosphodiesterase-like protein
MRKKWLYIFAAVLMSGVLVAMYVYERNRQEEIEALLQAALQQFQAESAESAPAPD